MRVLLNIDFFCFWEYSHESALKHANLMRLRVLSWEYSQTGYLMVFESTLMRVLSNIMKINFWEYSQMCNFSTFESTLKHIILSHLRVLSWEYSQTYFFWFWEYSQMYDSCTVESTLNKLSWAEPNPEGISLAGTLFNLTET